MNHDMCVTSDDGILNIRVGAIIMKDGKLLMVGNERAIKFYERYGFRFDGTEQEIKLGTPNTELRMIYERD